MNAVCTPSSSTVFGYAQQFNAPLGNWDVSRVTDMEWSEYIRVCDHVHHPCTPECYVLTLSVAYIQYSAATY